MFVFLIAALSLGILGYLRTSKYAFGIWFPFMATMVALPVLAFVNCPHMQPGPGGLTVLGAIPGLILAGICLVALIIGWFARPRSSYAPTIVYPTIAGYGFLLSIFIFTPSLWGGYTLRLQVLDWQHQPVSGLSIHCLRQKNGMDLINTLLPDDVSIDVITDKNGEAAISMNQHQRISVLVNTPGEAKRNSMYGYLDFSVVPPGDFGILSIPALSNRTEINILWNNPQEKDLAANMLNYSTTSPTRKVEKLTVFMPKAKGDFGNPYQN